MKTLQSFTSSAAWKYELGAAVFVLATISFTSPAIAQDAQIIELTQVNCQFVESENGINHGYESRRKADCKKINKKTVQERLATAETLKLKSGKYIFRVTNVSVDYPLGFYIRGASLIDKARLPRISGGGLKKGVTKDYKITLKEGEYVYSCPLNITPDYKLSVSES